MLPRVTPLLRIEIVCVHQRAEQHTYEELTRPVMGQLIKERSLYHEILNLGYLSCGGADDLDHISIIASSRKGVFQ